MICVKMLTKQMEQEILLHPKYLLDITSSNFCLFKSVQHDLCVKYFLNSLNKKKQTISLV